jgi:hypothetical protein
MVYYLFDNRKSGFKSAESVGGKVGALNAENPVCNTLQLF